MTAVAMGEMTAEDLGEACTTAPVHEPPDLTMSSDERSWIELATPAQRQQPERSVGRRWVLLRVFAAAVIVVVGVAIVGDGGEPAYR